jgi:hypothetical protein
MACLMGKVTGAMITGIAADVHRYRAAPPTIANTDGDPICPITSTIAVAEGTIGKLAACPDFDLDTDEPDRGTWWGALIPDGQREARMAEAKAQLRAQGHKDVEAPGGPQRWVRGVLRVRDRVIIVEVSSRTASHSACRHTPQGRRRAGGYFGEADRPGAGLRLVGRPARLPGRRRGRGRGLGEVLAR